MEGYLKPVDFYLPGIFEQEYFELYKKVVWLYKTYSHVFYDNVKISAMYDTPVGCIWNGGRSGAKVLSSNIDEVGSFLKENKIPLRFVFTNSQVKEKHLSDEFGNYLLDKFSTGKNEVITASPLLEEYIRNKCGDLYKYISSTTKCILSRDKLEEECDSHFLTVLDFRLNKNFSFLEKIKNKDKIEILINEACNYDCPNRKACYEKMSLMNINGQGIYTGNEIGLDGFEAMCNPKYELSFTREMTQPMFISNEDINSTYIPMGFSHFKLNGRRFPFYSFVESLVYYLIKDKYKIAVREVIFQNNYRILDCFYSHRKPTSKIKKD